VQVEDFVDRVALLRAQRRDQQLMNLALRTGRGDGAQRSSVAIGGNSTGGGEAPR
jgi:hypothetical protein